MIMDSPSASSYLAAAPTVLATVARYAVYGSPHPALSLRDLVRAALFKRFAADDLLPGADQSSYEARMATEFSSSVDVERVSLDPLEAALYKDELTHPDVLPQPVPTFFLTPKKQLFKGKILLYIHGGGYSRGNATGGGISNAMANKFGRLVCTIDYRLGPHTPFPAAVQDCITAYYHLRRTYKYTSDQIVLVGESAGAGLVIATLLHLRELGEKPDRAILMSPFMQTQNTNRPSFINFDPIDFISTGGLPAITKDYISLKPNSRYIQLPNNSFKNFPPLFVSYGDAEILCDDDRDFCEQARKDGVDVIEDVGVGKVHVWVALPQEQKEAKPVWNKMKQFVDGDRAKL